MSTIASVGTRLDGLATEPEVAPDQLLHDLVGPGPDPRDARVRPGAGDAVLVHAAAAAPQLDAAVEDFVRALAGPPLRPRRADGAERPGQLLHDAGVDEALG